MSRSFRGWLYWTGKILGDIAAVKKRKIGRRVGRRVTGKITGRGLRRLFK